MFFGLIIDLLLALSVLFMYIIVLIDSKPEDPVNF